MVFLGRMWSTKGVLTMSKGGGGGGVQESVVTQTNLPEYAEPFFQELLGRTVYESTRPYEAFPGQRIAEFDPFEQYGMQGMAEMAQAGTTQQITDASNIAANVGFQDVGMGMDIASGFRPPMQYSGYQAGDIGSGYQDDFLGQGYNAGQRGVGYQAGTFDPGYQARERQSGFDMGPLESGYQAGTFDPGYQARVIQSQYTGEMDLGSGFQAGTIADPATLESYMNPYQQLVTDIENERLNVSLTSKGQTYRNKQLHQVVLVVIVKRSCSQSESATWVSSLPIYKLEVVKQRLIKHNKH